MAADQQQQTSVPCVRNASLDAAAAGARNRSRFHLLRAPNASDACDTIAFLANDATVSSGQGDNCDAKLVFRRQFERLDWKRLAAIDVDRIYHERDYDQLADNLLQLAFCDLDSELTVSVWKWVLQFWRI